MTYNAATNTYTQVSAAGIPGFAQSNGRDLTAACRARDAREPQFVPTSVPAIGNHPTQRDTLYDVVEGGYYGHPNPTRCEFVLHEGNLDAQPELWARSGRIEVPRWASRPTSTTRASRTTSSTTSRPNGTIEYKSNTFGGQLNGRLAIVRFSNNNDLIFLQAALPTAPSWADRPRSASRVCRTRRSRASAGFLDPLEIIEDTRNGNLYVNQYNLGGNQQKLYLLRVPANQQAAKIGVDKSELVYSAVTSNGSLGCVDDRAPAGQRDPHGDQPVDRDARPVDRDQRHERGRVLDPGRRAHVAVARCVGELHGALHARAPRRATARRSWCSPAAARR